MDQYEREELKKEVLSLAGRTSIPLNPTYVSDKLGVSYPAALSLLYDLALEGHLRLDTRGWIRHFVLNNPDTELGVRKSKK